MFWFRMTKRPGLHYLLSAIWKLEHRLGGLSPRVWHTLAMYVLTMFGSTYTCEAAFSKINFIKCITGIDCQASLCLSVILLWRRLCATRLIAQPPFSSLPPPASRLWEVRDGLLDSNRQNSKFWTSINHVDFILMIWSYWTAFKATVEQRLIHRCFLIKLPKWNHQSKCVIATRCASLKVGNSSGPDNAHWDKLADSDRLLRHGCVLRWSISC